MGNGVRVDRAIRAVRPITSSTFWRAPIVINATAASSTVRRSRKFAVPGTFGCGWSMHDRRLGDYGRKDVIRRDISFSSYKGNTCSYQQPPFQAFRPPLLNPATSPCQTTVVTARHDLVCTVAQPHLGVQMISQISPKTAPAKKDSSGGKISCEGKDARKHTSPIQELQQACRPSDHHPLSPPRLLRR